MEGRRQKLRSMQKCMVARYALFKLRYELKLKHKILLASGFAGLTGLSAQIWIPLPFSPVPITMQVLTVLMAGVLLGGAFGALSQLIYVGVGAVGIPWFADFKSGLPWTFASGGYLIGFMVAAFVVGKLTDKFIRLRYFNTSLMLMFLGVLIIYAFGLVHLYYYFLNTGKPLMISEVFLYGAIPFIPGDIMKCVLAALMVGALCPKDSYDSEVDVGKTLSRRTKGILALTTVLGLLMFILAYFWWTMAGWIEPMKFEFAKVCITSSISMIILGIVTGKIFERKIKRERFRVTFLKRS